MAECAMLKGCIFFNDKMPGDVGVGAIYKKRYCLGDPANCARYMVATTLGRENVPSNLYPNMRERAEDMIKGRAR